MMRPAQSDAGSEADQPTGVIALRTARILGAIAVSVYPSYGVLIRAVGLDLVDPIAARLGVTFVIFGVLVGTYVSDRLANKLHKLLGGVVVLITLHCFYLLYVNALSPLIVISVFVLLAGFIATASYTMMSRLQLQAYMSLVVLLTLGTLLVEDPELDARFVLLSILSLTALAYVSARAQLVILRRLANSEESLRRDVARRQAIEVALRESESRATALLDAMPDVLMRLRRDGTVISVHNTDGGRLASKLGSYVGKRLDDLGVSATRGLERTLDSGDVTTFSCQTEIFGGMMHLEIRLSRTSANEGLALVRDVTQEKLIEEGLRTADRLVSLGTLASGVAHEINNPLSYVAANLDFALERVTFQSRKSSPEQDELLAALLEAQEGARRIRDIVASLKEHTRPVEDELSPVDLNGVVRAGLRMVDNQLKHRTRVELELNEVSVIWGHTSRLIQVLVNLLVNAVQALPDRPSSENLIRLKTFQDTSKYVVLEIEDNGNGIPHSVLGRIFDPFFTTKSAGEGTGLGLYLCHRFITAFGGTIAVESADGLFTRFRITLRVAAADTVPPPSRNVLTDVVIGSVLIVDDEALVARGVARILRCDDIVIVDSVDAGVAACKQRDFELILCDMMMPDKDGIAFLESLRVIKPSLASRVVFMTGGAFTERARTFLDAGSNSWLEKPINRERLLDIYRSQLSARGAA
jgi:signal transduction histidine kinase